MKYYVLTLILVLHPYSDIEYNKINAYEIDLEVVKLDIEETLGDGYLDDNVKNLTRDEVKEYFVRSIYSQFK